MRIYDGDVIITRPKWCHQWNNPTTIRYEFDITKLQEQFEVKVLYRPLVNKLLNSMYFFIDSAKFICKKVKSLIYRKHDFNPSN